MLKKAGAFNFREILHFHLVGSVTIRKLQLSSVSKFVYFSSYLWWKMKNRNSLPRDAALTKPWQRFSVIPDRKQ